MDTNIDGHKIRTLRASKLWEKWATDFYIKGLPIEMIANKYRRKDGKKYARSYMYQQMEKVKDKVINDHNHNG